MKIFFSNFRSHIKDSKWGRKYILSIVQAVTEVLNKSHFSLQMGNCPIPVAEHSGLRPVAKTKLCWNSMTSINSKKIETSGLRKVHSVTSQSFTHYEIGGVGIKTPL